MNRFNEIKFRSQVFELSKNHFSVKSFRLIRGDWQMKIFVWSEKNGKKMSQKRPTQKCRLMIFYRWRSRLRKTEKKGKRAIKKNGKKKQKDKERDRQWISTWRKNKVRTIEMTNKIISSKYKENIRRKKNIWYDVDTSIQYWKEGEKHH